MESSNNENGLCLLHILLMCSYMCSLCLLRLLQLKCKHQAGDFCQFISPMYPQCLE